MAFIESSNNQYSLYKPAAIRLGDRVGLLFNADSDGIYMTNYGSSQIAKRKIVVYVPFYWEGLQVRPALRNVRRNNLWYI